MTLIIDGLLVAAAAFAGTYCFVLARRVRALKDLDSGIGGAITRMTRALEDARRALEEAKNAGSEEQRDLKQLVSRAETASAQLRVLLAATRDLPEPAPPVQRDAEEPAPRASAHDRSGRRRLGHHAETDAPAEDGRLWHQPRVAASRRSDGGYGEDAHDAVPQPARLVRPATARLPSPRLAAPTAVSSGEADLIAALAQFAETGRA